MCELHVRFLSRLIFINIEPAVISLWSLGVIDVRATHVGDNEVLVHALVNTSISELEGGYAIRRSSALVNKYPRTDDTGHRTDGGVEHPNHMLGAFPTLWPYGKGGLETER